MKPFGPYSPAVVVNNTVYVSGQVPIDPGTGNALEDVTSQVAQAIANLSAVLKTVQTNLDSVVKVTVYLTDMADFSEMNAEYIKHFKEPRPARTTVAVKELPRIGSVPIRIEIDAIAQRKA